MKPPADIPATELFLKLQEAPAPSEVVPFPRNDQHGRSLGKVRIFVLRHSEIDQCRKEAAAWLKRTAPDVDGSMASAMLSDAFARYVLCRSVRAPEPIDGSSTYPYVFPTPEDLSRLLTAEELVMLFSAYQVVEAKFGAREDLVTTDEELNAWLRRLEEGARQLPLAQLDSLHAAMLISSLARRVLDISSALESLGETYAGLLGSLPTSWGIGTFSAGKRPAEPRESSRAGGLSGDEIAAVARAVVGKLEKLNAG